MGEKQPIPDPVDQTQATRLIIGFCTKPISPARAEELRKEYGCYFYYLHELTEVKALESISAEDQHMIVSRYDAVDDNNARMAIFAQVDDTNVVADLSQFKFKRILKHNLVLMYAHVVARNTGEVVPWAADQSGEWVPRYLYNTHPRGYRTLQRLVNIDWRRL